VSHSVKASHGVVVQTLQLRKSRDNTLVAPEDTDDGHDDHTKEDGEQEATSTSDIKLGKLGDKEGSKNSGSCYCKCHSHFPSLITSSD
jgi:hypothetical protein